MVVIYMLFKLETGLLTCVLVYDGFVYFAGAISSYH